jgi:hypothetical protein
VRDLSLGSVLAPRGGSPAELVGDAQPACGEHGREHLGGWSPEADRGMRRISASRFMAHGNCEVRTWRMWCAPRGFGYYFENPRPARSPDRLAHCASNVWSRPLTLLPKNHKSLSNPLLQDVQCPPTTHRAGIGLLSPAAPSGLQSYRDSSLSRVALLASAL